MLGLTPVTTAVKATAWFSRRRGGACSVVLVFFFSALTTRHSRRGEVWYSAKKLPDT